MRIRYFRCCVVRDAMMKIPRQGPVWERPVLEAIYGEGNLEDVEEFEADVPEPLSPKDELARLGKVYGREKRGDGSAGNYWADIVYGRGPVGVKDLSESMKDAIVEKAKKGKKPDAEDDGPGESA